MAAACWWLLPFLGALAIFFRLLWAVYPAFKYNIRLACYYAVLTWASAVSLVPSLLTPKKPSNLLYVSIICRYVVYHLLGLKCEIRNKEQLKLHRPCILVCNHQSSVDVVGMMYMWDLISPAVPVIKKEVRWTGPLGLMAMMSDCIFLDRGNSEAARKKLNDQVAKMAASKTNIWIFPEGTRSRDQSILPFKKGAFHVAIQAQLPIIPVLFLPYSFYNKAEKRFDSGTVIIDVLPPVSTKGMTTKDVGDLTEKVRNMMLERLTVEAEKGQSGELPKDR